MNITILANNDLASNIALNYLVSGLAQHKLTIFLSDKVGNGVNQPSALLDLKFFEQQLFDTIIFPAVDAQESSSTVYENPATLMTFCDLARVIDSRIESLNNINQLSGLLKLKATKPDVILSIRFGKILQQETIEIARLGVLNLHSGLLPQYQGVMATFWAMYNQEKNYGTTLHFIDSNKIDAGPIVTQIHQPLELDKSYLENVLALYPAGCNQIIQAVTILANGEKLTVEAPTGKSGYYSFPNESQLSQFAKLKMRLFDTQQILQIAKAYQSS